MSNFFLSILELVLKTLGWVALGSYRTKAKISEKALSASKKANEISNKLKLDPDYREHIKRLFHRKR